MEITGISTTYFAENNCPVAQVMSADGTLTEMPFEEAMKVLEAHRPKPAASILALEKDVIGMLFLLFQHKRAHPVILDGNEIGTTIGYKHNGDYFHYINGHTLEVSASKCVYNSLTYIDVIEPQETVWIQDMSVVGIAIHNFIDTSERVAPDNPRFHGQLEHVRDMLEQAVLRRILDTPPDGEATLDRKHIDRGYSQFCAAMY